MSLQDFIKDWHSDAPELLVHTSGSTGKPKPMWVEKERMRASARITCDFLKLKAGDNALLCLPMDYIAGKMMVVRCIERGMRIIDVEPSNHPLATVNDNIDFAAMVPSQVFCSLQNPEERQRLQQIRNIIIGGGAIPSSLQAELRTFPNAVWSTYGMTETLSHIAMRRLNGPEASEWYMPLDNVSISLNEEGCLVIDAPKVHNGVLTTNDIAELSPDGTFRIIGRKDNVICSGGIKLHIEKIEEQLSPYLPFPFCITKRKDEKFGEVAVMLATNKDTEAIHTICQKHLDAFAVPKGFIYTKDIPMTETGKIDRHKAALIAEQPNSELSTANY